MDFLSRILSLGEKLGQKKINLEPSSECRKLCEFQEKLDSLLEGKNYVARSEYSYLIPEYKETVEFFRVLQNSKMLKRYCAQNGYEEKTVLHVIELYDHLEEKIDDANELFINNQMLVEKEYLDNILKDVDPVIMLDADQRKVILTDEDYCLVIAGAGAGKTTTVAAKVKYLVEKKGIEPRDILVISFTNKAVGELRDKINKDLHIDCPIATFHSTGNAILRINDPEPLNIFDGSKLYFLLQDYFKQSILTNEALVNNLIMFFASYFEAPYEGTDLNEFFNKTAKATYKGKELKELARNTVNCLDHISENYYFGITILISVLRGGNRKQIVKHKLNEVNEYGIYADMSRDDMRAVVQWMINNHYILKTKAKYPVLHPTYNGNHFDECITKKQIKDLKKYLEDPNREVFEEEDSED